MSWTLVILVYAGVLSKGDSVALDHIKGFPSEQHCAAAGSLATSMVKGTIKELRFVCIRQQ